LQPQALQQRMDEALRWMAGQGVQAAQVRIAPEALGPITIHLHMSGDQASVAFVSAVDTTRQALEANLASLKEALNQQGFSLDQTFVGSQEQHAAQQSQQEALAKQTPGSLGADGASASSAGTAQTTAAPAASRQGLVDIFA
ncbi:MAG: flagellar hook-length control protein FliK, partial [Pigmentiphaga sp.]|nr:flagellar hook-length control protein FliK [Pigmentiphaga sp.]